MLFDIGANCGKYTRANIHKYDRIVCVDASELQCSLLRQNLPADKCVVVHGLVSNTAGAEFYRCSESGISSASEEWREGKGRFAPGGPCWSPSIIWTREECPVMKLDELIEKYGTPSFIKIDVEGHETEVIKSLSKYSGELAFEWAEEMKEELIVALNYIHEVLGHNEFYIQIEDAYTFEPDPSEYKDFETTLNTICSDWDADRKEKWGMIWCR